MALTEQQLKRIRANMTVLQYEQPMGGGDDNHENIFKRYYTIDERKAVANMVRPSGLLGVSFLNSGIIDQWVEFVISNNTGTKEPAQQQQPAVGGGDGSGGGPLTSQCGPVVNTRGSMGSGDPAECETSEEPHALWFGFEPPGVAMSQADILWVTELTEPVAPHFEEVDEGETTDEHGSQSTVMETSSEKLNDDEIDFEGVFADDYFNVSNLH
jgi:hypothetical protein